MLTLYRKRDCPACDGIESQLRERMLACKVVHLDDVANRSGDLPSDAELPVLRDDGETYTGSQAIGAHLDRIAQIQDRWQQHGADACYCDEDGDVL